MGDTDMLSTVATLLGEPARTRILTALLTGRAMTAKELAYFAGVTAAQGGTAGALEQRRQRRSRYGPGCGRKLGPEEHFSTRLGTPHAETLPPLPFVEGGFDRWDVAAPADGRKTVEPTAVALCR